MSPATAYEEVWRCDKCGALSMLRDCWDDSEMARDFGGLPEDESLIVCDDCFRKSIREFQRRVLRFAEE